MASHQEFFSVSKDKGSEISRLKDEIADLKKDGEIRDREYTLLQ